MLRRGHLGTVACIILSGTLWGNCPTKQDHRSDKASGLLITDFTISGTQTLSSLQLIEIENRLVGSCFDENSEELNERIRALFQDRGYFEAEVINARLKSGDPLAVPKPVSLEAQVHEGRQYRLAKVRITGNHVFTAPRLRQQFSLKEGNLFSREKIAGGLESVRKLYVANGFLDFTAIPDTQLSSNGTVLLTLSVEEGPQYRMGKLQIFGNKERVEKLYQQWQLEEGAIFDFGYIDRYIDANRLNLPDGFSREQVRLVRDCPRSVVDIRLALDPSDAYPQPQPKDIECEPQSSPN